MHRSYWHSQLQMSWKRGTGSQCTAKQQRKYIVQTLKTLRDTNYLHDKCWIKNSLNDYLWATKICTQKNGQWRVKYKGSETAFLLALYRIMLCRNLAASAETCFKGKVQKTLGKKGFVMFPRGEMCCWWCYPEGGPFWQNGEDNRGWMWRKLIGSAYKCK